MTDGHKYTFQGFDGPYWRAKEAAEREDLKQQREVAKAAHRAAQQIPGQQALDI